MFERHGMDDPLAPFKGCGGSIVRVDEAIDRLAELPHRREAGGFEGPPTQDAEPAFDLVEPTGMSRREMKMHPGMTSEPAVDFRFMRVEVVEDDVQFAIRIVGHDLVHEPEKLAASPTGKVPRFQLTGAHVERRKQRAGAIPRV